MVRLVSADLTPALVPPSHCYRSGAIAAAVAPGVRAIELDMRL